MRMSVCMCIVCIHVSLLQRMLQGYIMFVCVCGGGGGGGIMVMCVCMYVHVSLLETMLQGCITVMCVCMYVHVSLLETMLQMYYGHVRFFCCPFPP